MTASAEFRRRATAIRRLRHDELKGHGTTLRKALLVSVASATGGDRKFSGVGNVPTLGVSLRVTQAGKTTTVTLKPSPKNARGQWAWAQDGTKAGARAVKPHRRQGRSRRAATVEGFTYFHPGTSGSNAWFGPVDTHVPKIREAIRAQFDAVSR